MTEANAEELRQHLLLAARSGEAKRASEDRYGARYQLDFTLSRAGRKSIIRSYWIVRADERVPRLVTCFVA